MGTEHSSGSGTSSSTVKLAFAFRAKSGDGKEVTARVVATSVDHAWSKLEQKGFRDIVMLDTEHSAIRLDDAQTSNRLKLSASEEQSLRRRRSPLVTTAWLLFRPANLATWVPLTLWLIWKGVLYDWHGNAVYLPASLLGAYLVWFIWARVPSVLYNQALEASAWYDWAVVERRMRWLGRWKGWFNTPFKEHELLTRMAMAEAGQGRMAQALERVQKVAGLPDITPEFYQSRLASVYGVAKDYANALVAYRKSYEIKPSDTCAIDLATALAMRMNLDDEAQGLLDKIEVRKLSPLARSFYERCRGIIAIHRRDYEAAVGHMQQALELIKEHVGSPLMKGVTADIHAYHGIALAHCGRGGEALRELAESRAMLEAHEEVELLALCDAAKVLAAGKG